MASNELPNDPHNNTNWRQYAINVQKNKLKTYYALIYSSIKKKKNKDNRISSFREQA